MALVGAWSPRRDSDVGAATLIVFSRMGVWETEKRSRDAEALRVYLDTLRR